MLENIFNHHLQSESERGVHCLVSFFFETASPVFVAFLVSVVRLAGETACGSERECEHD
jgi:hypothetical protein